MRAEFYSSRSVRTYTFDTIRHFAVIRAQGSVSFPSGGHVNVLSDYKETVFERENIFYTAAAVMSLMCFRQNHIYQALLKCMHVHCPSILTTYSKKKWLKIITSSTLCLTRVITLQIHHSTEFTNMPALLYSFHIKIIKKNLKRHNY